MLDHTNNHEVLPASLPETHEHDEHAPHLEMTEDGRTYAEVAANMDIESVNDGFAAARFVDAVGGDLQLEDKNVNKFIAEILKEHGCMPSTVASGLSQLSKNGIVTLTINTVGPQRARTTTGVKIVNKEALYGEPVKKNEKKPDTPQNMARNIAISYAEQSFSLIERKELESALLRILATNADRLQTVPASKIINLGVQMFTAQRAKQINDALRDMRTLIDAPDAFDQVAHATALNSLEAMLSGDHLREREINWLTKRYGLYRTPYQTTKTLAQSCGLKTDDVSQVLNSGLSKIKTLVDAMQQKEHKIVETRPLGKVSSQAEVRRFATTVSKTKINGLTAVSTHHDLRTQTATMIYALPAGSLTGFQPSSSIRIKDNRLVISVAYGSETGQLLRLAPAEGLQAKHISLYDRFSKVEKIILKNIAHPDIRTLQEIALADTRSVQRQINEILDTYGLTETQLLSLSIHIGLVAIHETDAPEDISPKQQDIYMRYAKGQAPDSISRGYHVDTATIRNVLKVMNKKFGSNTELSAYKTCIEFGWLPLLKV